MQVSYDDQVFSQQVQGGISRYYTELIKAYRGAPELGIDALTPFRYVVNEHLMELDPRRFGRPHLPARAQHPRVLRALNRARRGLRPRTADVLHHTYYFADSLHRPARARLCTIYDMIPELFPELFPNGSPHASKDDYVAAADAIICISHSTKADLLKQYGELDKPVVVTPLGVGSQFFTPPAPVTPERPYVLFVGQRRWYKNFEVVLRAFARLGGAEQSLELACVGPALVDSELEQIAQLGLTDRVRRLTIADSELPAVYAAATCLVFPSRYEGFGLPIVEAFAAGCPAVLADMPCSLEVGGAAAQFFAPDDDEALAEILSRFVLDPASREPWIAAGHTRALDFTWRRTAELTAEVYRDLARPRRQATAAPPA